MVWDVGNGPGNCLLAMDSYISLHHPTFYHRESWRGDGGQAGKAVELEESGSQRRWDSKGILVQKLSMYRKGGGVQEHGRSVSDAFLFQLTGGRRRVAVGPDRLPSSFPFWQNAVNIPLIISEQGIGLLRKLREKTSKF